MMSEDATFRLRYVGTRFIGARLPLDVLSDLPAFRDLLVSYAKVRWRDRHAHRQRLPKGFDQSISFDLIALSEGSAVAQLAWSRKAALDYLPGFSDELEEIVALSYDDIVKLIDDAGHGDYPGSLPAEHIRALNRLGAGLREGEKIELPRPSTSHANIVFLDAHRRRNLIAHVSETYQIRNEGIGVLNGLHVDQGWISVATENYGDLRVKVDPPRVSEEFDGNTGKHVQFSLQLELDRYDRIRSVVDVFDIDLVDPEIKERLEKCKARLAELQNLTEGWHDGFGDPIAPTALQTAEALLAKRPPLLDTFAIFPTLHGGILFEFRAGPWDLSVEIANNGALELYGVEIDGPREFQSPVYDALTDNFLEELDRYAEVKT